MRGKAFLYSAAQPRVVDCLKPQRCKLCHLALQGTQGQLAMLSKTKHPSATSCVFAHTPVLQAEGVGVPQDLPVDML